ncbi:MAG: hypothetical protein ACM3NO_02830 [Deltaproteobacteria bacterium]
MREHPDHHDAELLLRLYDLRREDRLREAREWFVGKYQAASYQDLLQRYPRGSQDNARFRMVISYWDMVASIVNHGLIKEEFFFENTAEFWIVWQKTKPIAEEARTARKNPFIWRNLEALCEKYEAWMSGRAPDALESFRALLIPPPAAK